MSRRRRQVLPFTLTELFVLLFFALALALVREMRERRAAEEAATENEVLAAAARPLGPEGMRELTRILVRGGEDFPDDFRELTREIRERDRARRDLRSHLREAGLDSGYVDTASTPALVDSARALHDRAREEADALAAASDLSGEERSIVRAMTDSLADLARDRRALQGQVGYLRARIGNGLDHPPCWADESGEIEYAFEVTLRTSTVALRPIWPGHRRADAERIPGMLDAAGPRLDYDEFARRALPIFAWSRRQRPECRHFVVVVDSVAGGKEAYKHGLSTVERFFYKRLAN